MAFPSSIYAPPGVYTQTLFESPVTGLAAATRLPIFIGTGSEILTNVGLEIVRGSSGSTDTRIVDEDETGRAVVSISPAGQITLGNFNGVLDRIQVRNFPIVTGDGTGTIALDAASVSVTVNGQPVVVTQISGATGVLKLSVAPQFGDVVLVTYYFDRTDTRITDDLSEQVTPTAPIIYGQINQNYIILTGVNDTLIFTVDDEDSVNVTIAASPAPGWTAAQVCAFINSAATGTSLVATTAVNNFGFTVVQLTADRDITIGSGLANSTLGFSSGASTARNKTFYTFQRPIVDGTDGGVTTTDPSDVVVKVNGTQVIPTAVAGLNGAVVLPFAPEVGATVTCEYWFNSWQNTFDYLQNRGVIDVLLCGVTPDRNDYIEGTDFVLKDDRIVWGTAFLVSSADHTAGSAFFDSTQIQPTLVDVQQFLAPCTAVANTNVSPPVASATQFVLPLTPTTGNGRDNPLGTATFNAVSNGRTDLPTNRPDLVFAYWGFSLQDALDRGRVQVSKVDGNTNTITLVNPVPVGATVYASFYYNTIVDQDYTLAVVNGAASGVGTYTVQNAAGTLLPTSTLLSKSAGLATIEIVFPSGSERLPDFRHESLLSSDPTTYFVGPVEEDVTVTFTTRAATLGKYTVPSSGPYYAALGTSDRFRLLVDGANLVTGNAGINLSEPTGFSSGFFAQVVGNEVVYDAASGGTTFEIDAANNSVDLLVDGILVQASADANATATIADYEFAINRAANGDNDTAQAGATTANITLAATASAQDDYYVGWTIRITSGAASGDSRTVSAYNGTTKVAVVSVVFSAAPGAADYCLTNPDTLPQYAAASSFDSQFIISANEFDQIRFAYNGDTTGASGTLTVTLTPGTYVSASTLAAQIESDIAGVVGAGTFEVLVAANGNGQLVFSLLRDPTDTTGFLEFITNATPARDFAIVAGVSAAAAVSGQQMKLVHGPVARSFAFGGTPALYDRLILRNRIMPGGINASGSIYSAGIPAQATLQILGGTGASLAGLTPNEIGYSGVSATILPANLASSISFTDGQSASGQPLVTFYGASAAEPDNRNFAFSLDGIAVSLQFTDASGNPIASGASADVPLGPAGSVNTVLNQIAAAMASAGLGASAAAVISAGYIKQEGCGIRFLSLLSTASSVIAIGTGSANGVLGFSNNTTASSTPLAVEVLVSGLMAQTAANLPDTVNDWTSPSATYFAEEALAKTVTDAVGAKYLFVQSQGTAGAGLTSSVAFATATSASVTLPGVGLGIISGDGNTGEAAITGFYVLSTDPVNGSGTANTSYLNSGAGQDGTVGQTYRDYVTGLTFTVLPRPGNASYPVGSSFVIRVRNTATTNATTPTNTIPGLQLLVLNTSGIATGDSATVNTFKRTGAEPAVGDIYYATYQYLKQDYSTQLFTRLATVEAAYGVNSPENPVVLAAYLAFLNGAIVTGIKQVQKDIDDNNDGVPETASEAAYIAAIDSLNGTLPGGALPSILTLLKGDSLTLFSYLAKQCDIQSSIRYRAERTAVCGVSAGTSPVTVTQYAQAIARTRFRLVYPDVATLTLSRADGATQQYLVDGTFLASALIGSLVSPTTDVATPWTNRRLFGFDRLARTLDAVQQNQIAVKGVTILEDQNLVIRVRQGLTTDMTNVLTRTPTVITIADEVQQQTRATLDRFIGIKFLPGVTTQIEGQLGNTLKLLVQAQIIAAYTGIRAKVADDDPTVAEVEAFYQPVFPLLYIVVTFNLRSSL